MQVQVMASHHDALVELAVKVAWRGYDTKTGWPHSSYST